MEHSFHVVHHVNGLKYNISNVWEICDEQNEVKFLSNNCGVTNFVSQVTILKEKKMQKHVYGWFGNFS